MEIEQNSMLLFWDALLIKTHQGIEHAVYRKPIASECIVSYYAQAPLSHKVSAFRHPIQRVFTVCTSNQLNNEKSKIYDIARDNGYKKKSTIKKLIMSLKESQSTKFHFFYFTIPSWVLQTFEI